MNILILYTTFQSKERRNTSDHLYSFRRYVDDHTFYYLNVRRPKDISWRMTRCSFDAVLLHYSFLARRYDRAAWPTLYAGMKERLVALEGYKAALTQDEYHYTADLWTLFRDAGVKHIFSIAREANFGAIFPPEEVRATVSPVPYGLHRPAQP